MSQGSRPYQGYLSSNLVVTDAPTLSPGAANRWANLPKTQIQTVRKKEEKIEEKSANENLPSQPRSPQQTRPDSLDQVVYIDLPEDHPDTPSPSRTTDDGSELTENLPTQTRSPQQTRPDSLDQVVYIDLPEDHQDTPSPSRTTDDGSEFIENLPTQTRSPQQTRPDSLDQVVYIDLPEDHQDTPSPSRTTDDGSEFIEETIFYDPFKDRRIEVSRDNSISPTREETEGGPSRPNRPANLDLQLPSASTGLSPHAVPPFMSKEANIYRRPTPDDGFNLTPIPVADFPEPPPAYSEFDNVRPAVTEQPRPSMPRTQVTVSPDAIPMSADRKYVNCPHCQVKVHTLVVRQTGMMTHAVALVSFMVCLWPVTIAVYCMECSKYKNHYCPSCNNLIGYEIPMCCQSMVYVKP